MRYLSNALKELLQMSTWIQGTNRFDSGGHSDVRKCQKKAASLVITILRFQKVTDKYSLLTTLSYDVHWFDCLLLS